MDMNNDDESPLSGLITSPFTLNLRAKQVGVFGK